MPRGQSAEAQSARLANGRCPVHGIPMYQVGRWYQPLDGRPAYTVVACSRKNCEVIARESPPFHDAQVLPSDFVYPDPPCDMFELLENWLGDDPSRHDAVIACLRRRRDAVIPE